MTTRSRQRREQRTDKTRRRWQDAERPRNPTPVPRRSGPRSRGGRA